jgi:hypothetical protein
MERLGRVKRVGRVERVEQMERVVRVVQVPQPGVVPESILVRHLLRTNSTQLVMKRTMIES